MERAFLVALLAIASATGSARADDWSVRRDPFDPRTIARYKAVLARDPHDPALAQLIALYRGYRTVAQLVRDYDSYEDWAALVVRGRIERANKDVAQARKAWTRALEVKPDDARTWLLVGELERSAGNYRDARAAYERAARHAPTPAIAKPALAVLVELALAAGDHEGADAYYRDLLVCDPKDARVWTARADALLAAGNAEAALASYAAAETRLARDPERRVEIVIRRGDALARLGRHVEAIAELHRALAAAPALEDEITVRLVAVYRKQRALPELLAQLEAKWSPGSRGLSRWMTLGEVYDEVGDPTRAIAAFEAATKLAFDDLRAQRKLIALYEAAGRHDAVQARYDRLARDLPREPTFQLALAARYWPARDELALATLRRLATRMPNDAGVLAAIAELYASWQRRDLAIAAYEQLAKLEPEYLVSIGEQLALVGDTAQLGQLIKRVTRRRDPVLLGKLGAMLLDHAMYAPARYAYTEALALNQQDPALWRGSASANEGLEMWETAAADAEHALALTGSDPKARHAARHQLVRAVLSARGGGRYLTAWQIAFDRDDLDAGYLLAEYLAFRPCIPDPERYRCSSTELQTTLDRLVLLVPDDPAVRSELARTLRANREFERAITELRELARIAPHKAREVDERIAAVRADIARRDPVEPWEPPVRVRERHQSADALYQRVRLGARVGFGTGLGGGARRIVVVGAQGDFAIGNVLSITGRAELAQRDGEASVDIAGAGIGVMARILTTPRALFAVGPSVRAEVRGSEDTTGYGVTGGLGLQLTSRHTPLGVGLRIERDLGTGPANPIALLELAVELR